MARYAGTNCDFAVEQSGSGSVSEVLLPTENWELNIEEIADDITNSRSGILEEDLFIRMRWTFACDLVLESTTFPTAIATLGNGIVAQRALVRAYLGDRLGVVSFTDYWTGVVRVMNNAHAVNSKKAGRCRVNCKGISLLYAPGASVPGTLSTTVYPVQ